MLYLVSDKLPKKYNIGENTNINYYYFIGNCLSKEKGVEDKFKLYYKLLCLNYSFSFEYNLIEIKFAIKFYDIQKNIISPSDLTLFYNLHVLCHLEEKKKGIAIDSFAKIINNEYIVCIEYSKIKEKSKYGIKIYKDFDITTYIIKYLSIDKFIDYDNINHKKDNLFNNILINDRYNDYLNKLKNKEEEYKYYRLVKQFILPPSCFLKRDIANVSNQWFFANIYNNYFCFCKGINCFDRNIDQKCKYKFYLTIINENRNLYHKNSILISDFFEPNIEPADGYPLFKEMINQDIKAYYMTIDEKIYNDFYINQKYDKNNLKDFPIILEKYINGDFLEKYLELILKLKIVLSIDNYHSIDNLFYNIDYINYIFLGHGTHYFKTYLYKDYHGISRFDKIILPPSNIIINLAKKYGWKDKDIIKNCLPRFDKYNYPSNQLKEKANISIFLMFTWRVIKKGKNISDYYLNNTKKFLTDKKLTEALINNNIILYYSYHHSLKDKIKINLKNNQNIKEVNQSNISECLKNSKLLITDFSSIIFDFIQQRKPFLLYVPDSEDPFIKDIYSEEYYNILKGLKNDSLYFINKYFNLREAIDKIIDYINKNFTLEKKLVNFNKSFNLTCENNTQNLSCAIKKKSYH